MNLLGFEMSYTSDVGPELRCQRCGRREHGTAACETVYSEQLWEPFGYWPWPKGTRFRVMDGELFILDRGSPPNNIDELTRND